MTHKHVGIRGWRAHCERLKHDIVGFYLQAGCKNVYIPSLFFCIPFFVVSGIELKRLQSWACWACTFTVCSHPIPDRPWGTKLINPTPTTTTKKIKNSKIQNRTLWAVAPHSLWLEYEIETETYRGTCRTGFDDAVKQTLLSEKSCTLESFHHTAAAAWYTSCPAG